MGVPFENLQQRVNRAVVRGFANCDATFSTSTTSVRGIFSSPYAQGGVGPHGMGSTAPVLKVNPPDLPADITATPFTDQHVTIGAVEYVIRDAQPDGQGLFDLVLEIVR